MGDAVNIQTQGLGVQGPAPGVVFAPPQSINVQWPDTTRVWMQDQLKSLNRLAAGQDAFAKQMRDLQISQAVRQQDDLRVYSSGIDRLAQTLSGWQTSLKQDLQNIAITMARHAVQPDPQLGSLLT